MSERINKFLKGELATSILYLILGLCMVAMPVGTVYFFSKIIFGAVMIGIGLYQVYIYLREKQGSTVLDMFAGGMLLVLGGFLFFNPQIVVKILPVLLGMFILIDSVWTIKGAVGLKKKNQPVWKVLLIGSLIFVAAAIVLMVNLFELRITFLLAGWALLANGIVDLVFLFIIRRGMKMADKATEDVSTDVQNDDAAGIPRCESQGAAEAGTAADADMAAESAVVETGTPAALEKTDTVDTAAPAVLEEAAVMAAPEEPAASQPELPPVDLSLDPEIRQEVASSAEVEKTEEEPIEEWKD